MDAITLIFAVTALFLQANSLEYQLYNITYCPEIPGERAYITDIETRIQDDQQQFKGSEIMNKDFGNDNTVAIEAYRILEDKEVRLLNYKGKQACSLMLTYGGDAYLKVAKMANVENPTKCPIAKNNYSIEDFFGLSASDVPQSMAKLVPKGKFRVKAILTDTATGNVDYCCQIYAELF